MTLEDSIPWTDHQGGHALRLRVIIRAQQLGDVSEAGREVGISRRLFSRQDTGMVYRWRKRFLAYGPDGLHPGRQRSRRASPPSLSLQAERSILARASLTWGPVQLASRL